MFKSFPVFVQLSCESVVFNCAYLRPATKSTRACLSTWKTRQGLESSTGPQPFLPLFWLVFWVCFPGLCPCLWLSPPWGWSLLWSPEWVLLRSAWYKPCWWSPFPLFPHLHLGGRRKDKCGVWMKRQLQNGPCISLVSHCDIIMAAKLQDNMAPMSACTLFMSYSHVVHLT